VSRHRRRPNDQEPLAKPPFTPFGGIENGSDEGALIFERQADPMRLLDSPLRRTSLLSNAEVARLMALSHTGSHMGPEGVPQDLDFMGSFGLASFRQNLRRF
jgi:hypothetical protein